MSSKPSVALAKLVMSNVNWSPTETLFALFLCADPIPSIPHRNSTKGSNEWKAASPTGRLGKAQRSDQREGDYRDGKSGLFLDKIALIGEVNISCQSLKRLRVFRLRPVLSSVREPRTFWHSTGGY